MGRLIGVSYRVKQTAKGEARPTMVSIKDGDRIVVHKLETEDDELDFANGKFPIKWETVGKEQVATAFEGLREGDEVAMVLGAGNKLAGLLFIKGKKVGAKVYRLPPMYLKEHRPDPDKNQDHINLLQLLEQKPHLFYEVRQPDKDLIVVAAKLDMRQEAQKARIACGNRLIQSVVGRTFLNEEEQMEGLIKDRCEALMVSDVVYAALVLEEEKRNKELERAVKCTAVWPIFKPIPGVGPRIAAGFISPIGDIRRFMVLPDFTGAETPEEKHRRKNKALEKGAAKLMKFCGVHVMPDGRFPRRRSGEVANWSPAARQALYLLADQFNRKPDSYWGKKLLQYKASFRQKHPEPVEVEAASNGNSGLYLTPDTSEYIVGEENRPDSTLLTVMKKKLPDKVATKKKKKVMRYTDGHILKMAKWRTLTRFVRYLFKQWARIES